MSSSSDPILALKEAIKSGKGKPTITYKKGSATVTSFADATHLVLSPTATFPKNAPTRLRKTGATSTDPETTPEDFYSLGAVYLAWLLRDAAGADYMKRVRENGLTVGFVSVTDRKSIVDWLTDRSQTLPGLITVQGVFQFSQVAHGIMACPSLSSSYSCV